MINHWLLRILSFTWYFLSIKRRLCSIVWKRNSQAVACLFDTDLVFLNWFPCLVRTKRDRSLGADILGCCEYERWNSGTDQTAGPRPSRRGGLGSLQNEPWCGSLEMWKRTHLALIKKKNHKHLDVTCTCSAVRIMGIIVWLAVAPRLAARCRNVGWKWVMEQRGERRNVCWILGSDIQKTFRLLFAPCWATTQFHPTVRQKHIKSMLENIHKNADAFNTFRVRMREKELDWSADQYISRWISMIVYFHRRFLPLSSPLPRPRPFCPMF